MITVTSASPDHAEAIAGLLEEMDRFYGSNGAELLEARVRQINDAIFTSPPAAYALLAWEGMKLSGFAAYSFLWPAVGLTRSLYLKELYVAEAHRHGGTGRFLMRAIFDAAEEHGCSRVEWTTDTDNTGAQDFYDKLGLPKHPSKVFYRVEGSDITRGRLR
jgi:GNAT superfamily N-acetyltransferase